MFKHVQTYSTFPAVLWGHSLRSIAFFKHVILIKTAATESNSKKHLIWRNPQASNFSYKIWTYIQLNDSYKLCRKCSQSSSWNFALWVLTYSCNTSQLVLSEPIWKQRIQPKETTKGHLQPFKCTHTHTHTPLSSAHAWQQIFISINCGSLYWNDWIIWFNRTADWINGTEPSLSAIFSTVSDWKIASLVFHELVGMLVPATRHPKQRFPPDPSYSARWHMQCPFCL